MHATYILGDIKLTESMNEKDLGVLMDHIPNNSLQCQPAISKVSKNTFLY